MQNPSYKCHQVDGRGNGLGPDLSTTTAVLSRRRLVESILQPSKEIAPQFVPWSIETVEGKALVGMMTSETAAAEQTYVDADGNTFTLRESDIDRRQQRPVSIMPDDLHRQLTPGEFRDLLAYLHQPR